MRIRTAASFAGLFILASLPLVACQRETAVAPQPVATAAPEAPAASPSITVEGWQTDTADYPMLGMTLPTFSAPLHGGGTVTQDALRDHWTILGFWNSGSDDSVADARYIQALNSAAGQDPDLAFLSVHIPAAGGAPPETKSLDAWFSEQGGPWPTALDADGSLASTFMVSKLPTYLLVGPDLTIEGYRGALNATPDDGIKSVIRGVAQIRKQIAAPG
jgi:hypothetical protein